jgi:hypothetical protein
MAQHTDPLSFVRIAAPCRADWEQMSGNEQVRFCGQCSLNVYNLSNMSKRDAEALIMGAEGKLCVRYYRRADGTILTANCPAGLQILKRRVSKITRAVISTALSFFAGMGVFAGLEKAHSSLSAATEAGRDLIDPVPLEQFEPRETAAPEPVERVGELAREPTGIWVLGGGSPVE